MLISFTRASNLSSIETIRSCWSRGGMGIDIFDKAFPLVNALVVYELRLIISLLILYVAKQYEQYLGNSSNVFGRALKIKPLNIHLSTSSIRTLVIPISSFVSDVRVKKHLLF